MLSKLVVVLSLVVGMVCFANSAHGRELYSIISEPYAASSQSVNIELNLPSSMSAQSSSNLLSLPLFDKVLKLNINYRESRSDKSWMWRAESLSSDEQSAIITVENGNMRATIYDKFQSYNIYHEDGKHYLLKSLDAGKRPFVCNAVMPEGLPRQIKSSSRLYKQSNSSHPTIDVLIVVTKEYWELYQNRNIYQHVQHYFDCINTFYQKSQIEVTFRLAYIAQIDDPNLDESNQYTGRVLDRLTWHSEILTIRDRYGADMVCLFRVYHFGTDAGGRAFIMTPNWVHPDFRRRAFSLVEEEVRSGAYSIETFAHELGHNLGCAHNRENANQGAYPYAHGHRFFHDDGTRYGTIMSYYSSSLIRFSNPNLSFQGYKLGVELNHAEPSFNAMVINQTKQMVSEFSEPIDYWNYTSDNPQVKQKIVIAPHPVGDYGARIYWQQGNYIRAEINIYNMAGEPIRQYEQGVGGHNFFRLYSSGIAPGIYFYRLRLQTVDEPDEVLQGKIAIIKKRN